MTSTDEDSDDNRSEDKTMAYKAVGNGDNSQDSEERDFPVSLVTIPIVMKR